jgi:hypothetical protein
MHGVNNNSSGTTVFFWRGVQAMASWRSLLTMRHSRNLSESRIRAVQCYDCPAIRAAVQHHNLKHRSPQLFSWLGTVTVSTTHWEQYRVGDDKRGAEYPWGYN